MITHEITTTKSYSVARYSGNTDTSDRLRFGPGEHVVKNQKDLDEYLEKRPWVKEGVFITFKSNERIKTLFTLHFIAEIQRSYAALPEVRFPRPGGVHPKLARVVCCNFNDNGESSWQRWDDVEDFRPVDEKELVDVLDDNVRNRIEAWKKANGYGRQTEPAPSPY